MHSRPRPAAPAGGSACCAGIGWLPPLVTQSRNSRIQPGGPGYLDASLNTKILEIPQGQITRAMGDVHPLGNPHYWLDPENGKIIARSLAAAFTRLRPNDAAMAKVALGLLSRRKTADGQPIVDTPLTAQDGWVYIGPIRLAPVPRIPWP